MKHYNWYTCFHTFVDISLQLILTKMDKLDLCGLCDCSGIFQSRHAYKKSAACKIKIWRSQQPNFANCKLR